MWKPNESVFADRFGCKTVLQLEYRGLLRYGSNPDDMIVVFYMEKLDMSVEDYISRNGKLKGNNLVVFTRAVADYVIRGKEISISGLDIAKSNFLVKLDAEKNIIRCIANDIASTATEDGPFAPILDATTQELNSHPFFIFSSLDEISMMGPFWDLYAACQVLTDSVFDKTPFDDRCESVCGKEGIYSPTECKAIVKEFFNDYKLAAGQGLYHSILSIRTCKHKSAKGFLLEIRGECSFWSQKV
jgi:hypothetical protein